MSTVSASGESRNRCVERVRQTGEVPVHRLGRRRDVDVVAEVLGRNLIGDLDQPAIEADVDVERETGLRLLELLLAQEAIRERVVAEREEEIEMVALAGPARCHRRSSSCRFRAAVGPVRRASHHSAAERSRSSSELLGLPAEHAPRAGAIRDERRNVFVRRHAGAEADQLRIPGDLRDGQREVPHRRRPAGADVVEAPQALARSAESQREGLGDVVDVVEVAQLVAVGELGRLAAREPGDEVREQARGLLVAPEDVEEAEVDPVHPRPVSEPRKQLVLLGLVPRVRRSRIHDGALVQAHAGREHPGAAGVDDARAVEPRKLREQRLERSMADASRPRRPPASSAVLTTARGRSRRSTPASAPGS